MTSPPRPKNRRVAWAAGVFGAVRARQRRLEARLERRFPALYDARHAARGMGRAVWPLLGPLLAALIVVPIVALLAALVALLGLSAPSIDLPSVDLPAIPFPDVAAPGWLRAIGQALGAVISVIGVVAKYAFIAVAVVVGLRRTQTTRRRRAHAERLGRHELWRRLAVTLRAVHAVAREREASTVGAAATERGARPSARGG